MTTFPPAIVRKYGRKLLERINGSTHQIGALTLDDRGNASLAGTVRTALGGRRIEMRPMVCGRRYDGMIVRDWPVDPPREDHWRTGGGLVEQGAVGVSCSHCGSLHPDALMARLADGWTLEGSDKPYKWYLRNDDGRTVAKFYTVHLRRDQAELLLTNLGNGQVRHSLYVRPWLPSLSESAPAWLADG
jgi:hypothetical protein